MNSQGIHILVVDDDTGHLATLETIIKSWGYHVDSADDGAVAVEKVKAKPFDLVVMDVRMASVSGIEALQQIKSYNPAVPVLIMTAYSSVETAVEALKSGAYDYLTKPLDFDALQLTIERAIEHTHLKAENRQLKRQLYTKFDIGNIVGTSQPMKAMMDMLAMVAPSEATVLILGESGTGKEMVASAIHYNSSRKQHPLVVVNCAALSETLLESELFGHEKGAFTGADKRRDGRFMQADGGTIFLDEIGETSPAMQAKLLRVLQEKEIQRVGGDNIFKVDVRIIAATNQNLEKNVSTGTFREDLFYRLNVVTLTVPPLRDRRDDIPLLAQHFLERYADKNRKTVKGFSPQAMDMLVKYEWPGNVRELENAIERAVILLTGDFITAKELPITIAQNAELKESNHLSASRPYLPGSLDEIERDAILTAYEACGRNKSETARRLGITRKTLHKKLKIYGKA